MALASSSMMHSLASSYINLHFQLNQQKGLTSISTRRRNNNCRFITSCSSFTNNNPLLIQAAMNTVIIYSIFSLLFCFINHKVSIFFNEYNILSCTFHEILPLINLKNILILMLIKRLIVICDQLKMREVLN